MGSFDPTELMRLVKDDLRVAGKDFFVPSVRLMPALVIESEDARRAEADCADSSSCR